MYIYIYTYTYTQQQKQEVSLVTNMSVLFDYHQHSFEHGESSKSSEIIEEEDLFEIEEEGVALETIKEELFEGSLFSFDVNGSEGSDNVYVCVGKSESSMVALQWTLENWVYSTSTVINLVHIYPEVKLIPSPCKFLFVSSFISLYAWGFLCSGDWIGCV